MLGAGRVLTLGRKSVGSAPVVLALLLVAPALRAESVGQVNFFLGQKTLDAGDWDPVDEQGEFGAVMSFGQDDWPVYLAVDFLASLDEGEIFDVLVGEIDVTGSTVELDVGVRKIWGRKSFHPYAGGGLALVNGEIELDSSFGDAKADDDGLGAWLGGGAFWRLGKMFHIGADLRWSSAEIAPDIEGTSSSDDIDAGGLHLGLLLGFGW
jgi:hypothetical protein